MLESSIEHGNFPVDVSHRAVCLHQVKSPRWIRWKSEKQGRLKFGLKKDSQLLKVDGWNRILNKIGAKLSEQNR